MTWIWIILAFLGLVLVYDLCQKKHAILRNFPIIGHFRYILEAIGPELRQYIVTDNDEERPFTRDQRRWIYATSNKQNEYFGFGTDNDLEQTPNYVLIKHSSFPLNRPTHSPDYPIPCAKVLGQHRNRRRAFRFSETNERAFTRISAVVRDSLSFVTKGLANFVRSIGEAMVIYSSLVEGDDNFFFDAGNDAIAAARKIEAFGFAIDDISDPAAARAMQAALRQMQIVAVRAGIEVDKLLVGASEKLEGIGAEFVDDISARVPLIEEIMDAVAASAQGVGTDFDALKAKIQAALDQMGTIELTSPEKVDAAAKLTKHLEMLKGIVGELPQGYNDAAAAAQGFNEEAGETTSKISGMNDGVKEFRKRMTTMGEDIAAITENAIVAFGNGLTDAFVSLIDGSKSAKEAFADFASQFLIDIGRMIIQMLIFQAISAGMGALGFGNTMFGGLANGGTVEGGVGEMTPLANGGVVSGGLGRALPVKGYANGGPIVNKPHVALIGEGKYNEAVVPLPDGRSIPVEMQGGGGANVTVEINAVDARSVDMLFRERKDTLTDIIRNAISQSRQFRSAVGGA